MYTINNHVADQTKIERTLTTSRQTDDSYHNVPYIHANTLLGTFYMCISGYREGLLAS